MIRAHNLSLSFGTQDVLKNVSFMMQPHEKIGVVGANGAGKSTLLKVLAGEQGLQSGTITMSKGLRVAYLAQDLVATSEKTVFQEAFTAFGDISSHYEEELELAQAGKMDTPRFAELHALLQDANVGAKIARTHQVLEGLGFESKGFEAPFATLSVGWQMRVILARLLLSEADIYLFDEPTNHLDLVAKEWFCSYLESQRAGYLLISHDRYFLDHACTKVYELSQGNLRIYDGNYSAYKVRAEQDAAQRRAQREAQEQEILRLKRTADRFRAKANKARMAQSMLKKIDKIELVDVEHDSKTMSIPLPIPARSGRVVLTASKVQKSFGEKHLFSDVSFQIERGQKVALIAPNGKGKTTLLNCITGSLNVDAGAITFGHNVKSAVFEQEQVHVLDPEATIYDEVLGAATRDMRDSVRTLLGCFLFSGDDVDKKTKVLSGGERNRVAMAKVLVQNANFLLLDEPTNHLDLQSKEVLQRAIAEYDGTVLFVSHDRDFIEHVATHILSLDHEEVVHFPGNYEAFCYQYPDHHTGAVKAPARAQKEEEKVGPTYEEQKRFAKLDRMLEKYTQEQRAAEAALGAQEYGTDAYYGVLKKYESARTRVEQVTPEWEELFEKIHG